MKSYDLAIIGSGPGGYVAGLYASRHNLVTCVIEKGLVGGTCLNRGCIPTKSLLNSASIILSLKESSVHGIDIDGYHINFEKMMSRKDEVTNRLRTGIETLFRANKVDLIRGQASLVDQNTIKVGQDAISAKQIILAVGSKVSGLPNLPIDEVGMLSSDGALSLKNIPKSILIVGGGVVGAEFATLFNSLGSKVSIVEVMDRLIPCLSREASKKLELTLKKRGVEILTSAKVEQVSKNILLSVSISGGRMIEAEKVLVSVGRIPSTDGLGLEKAGIDIERGRVVVDEYLRTKAKNIFAIGDCVSGPLLAHKASYDAMLAVDNICGKDRIVDYSNIPNCIWTNPEIATVGLIEEEARAKCPDLRSAKFPYLASGKAYIKGAVEGYVKILGDPKGNIIGVEIFGDGACDLIGEAVLARTMGIKIGDWARVVHGHPTLSEILQEAAHVFCGTPIHSI
ncbi:MAG: dihydrolipoyl dehydrogenase [Candidatus Omnitrophota bacterium]|nr:dihydrolipoyl dehydrogenase [Candidatus Omnitrophota bacterium]